MPYSRSRRGRQDNYVSPAVSGLLGEVKDMLGSHLRNETILTEPLLAEFDLLKPKNWNEESVKPAIDAVWGDLGFSGRSSGNAEVELPDSAQETLGRYHDRTLDPGTLSASRVTRDRKAILEATGIDILDPKRSRKPQIASVGRQLSYVSEGTLPPPISIGPRAVGWRNSELSAWLEAWSIASRTKQPVDMKAFVTQLIAPKGAEYVQ